MPRIELSEEHLHILINDARRELQYWVELYDTLPECSSVEQKRAIMRKQAIYEVIIPDLQGGLDES